MIVTTHLLDGRRNICDLGIIGHLCTVAMQDECLSLKRGYWIQAENVPGNWTYRAEMTFLGYLATCRGARPVSRLLTAGRGARSAALTLAGPRLCSAYPGNVYRRCAEANWQTGSPTNGNFFRRHACIRSTCTSHSAHQISVVSKEEQKENRPRHPQKGCDVVYFFGA
jgi:hypothetical protein